MTWILFSYEKGKEFSHSHTHRSLIGLYLNFECLLGAMGERRASYQKIHLDRPVESLQTLAMPAPFFRPESLSHETNIEWSREVRV
jgi:hypothetical protein